MASIEERLNREDWNPKPGDTVIGEITGITARQSKKGDLYPVLFIKDDTGTEHIVSCALMASDVIMHRPDLGERCGVKFHGPQPKRDDPNDTWDKYTIVFERETVAQVDWSAMASARGIVSQPRSTDSAAASGDGPWSGEPAQDVTPPPF